MVSENTLQRDGLDPFSMYQVVVMCGVSHSTDFPVQIITEDYLVRNAIDTFMAQERKMSEQFTKLQKRKVKWAEEVREKKERLEAAALERQKANQPEYQATESLLAAAVATNEEERPTLKQAEVSYMRTDDCVRCTRWI